MTPTDNFLIIGSDSTLGNVLKEYLISHEESVVETTRRKDTCGFARNYLDLSKNIDNWQPPSDITVAFLCAAVTSMEACRKYPSKSALINVYNTVKVAEICKNHRIFVIFPSTNLVFDGTIPQRIDTDLPSPQTEYGRQKADAEQRLLAMGEGIAIVRFSKILVPRMPLITGWMQSLRSNQVIRPFSDYVMAPVPISLAAETLHKIAQNQDGGIFQVSGPNDVTYSDIAYHVAGRLNVSDKLISPVRVEDAGIYMDHNPRFTTLDTWRIKQRYGMKIPDAFSSVDWVFFHG